jgi:hypothetical protein
MASAGRPAARLIVASLLATLVVAGCKQSADDFFSGRPSDMSMVHNRVIGGPPEAMVELLRVPVRFPDAKEGHVADWQESAIAWWRNPQGKPVMLASLGKISTEEADALRRWVRVRDPHRSKEKAQTLEEIEAAMSGRR